MSKKDQLRFDKETKQLKEKGYFINSDGVKSTDLKVKPKKGKMVAKTGPVMPKRVLSPYLCFSKEFYANKKTKDGKSAPEVMKEIAASWGKMTPA